MINTDAGRPPSPLRATAGRSSTGSPVSYLPTASIENTKSGGRQSSRIGPIPRGIPGSGGSDRQIVPFVWQHFTLVMDEGAEQDVQV